MRATKKQYVTIEKEPTVVLRMTKTEARALFYAIESDRGNDEEQAIVALIEEQLSKATD